jgi:magnesium transporter
MRIDITKNLDKINLGDPVRNFIHAPENVLKVNMPVEEAIEGLWRQKYNPQIDFFYVLDHQNILCGVISSHKLLHGKKGGKICDLMEKNIIKLKDRYSIAEALMALAEEHLVALPIVNDEGVLLGIIELVTEMDTPTFDEFTHSRMKKRATKDLYNVLGLSVEQHRNGVLPEYNSRMPWLIGNIFAGLICALIVYVFHDVISGAFVLAMFIPLVLTLCESIAMQATINTSQYLHNSKIPWHILIKRGGKELHLSFLIAATAAAITGAITLFIGSQFIPMLVIAISIFVTMIIASALGMGVTIFVHKKGWDPKFASGPVVLMCTDIITTAAYFTIAYLFLS